jgi:hypothetical protein
MANFDLPSTSLQECTFFLDDGTASVRSGAGRFINVSQIMDPSWRAKLQTGALDQAGRQAWTAWKAKLKGGLNRFLAYDVSRQNPLNYLGARSAADIASAWAGTGTMTTVGSGGAMSIGGLPAAYVASAGDRLALESGGYFGYFEILTGGVASAGGALSIEIAPNVNSYFAPGSTVRLWRPRALFVIDWQSVQMSVIANPSAISFDAYQVLK